MSANSSVMPWEIGEYWGMGRFQNNGAAGGLDLRHRYCRCNSFCFVVPVCSDETSNAERINEYDNI